MGLFTTSVLALNKSNVEDVYFNLGTHTEYYNNIQNNSSGGVRKFDLAPTIGVGAALPIINEFKFIPEFNWVLPRQGSGRILKNIFMFRADLSYDPLKWLRLRMGTSLIFLNQYGRGGTKQINNGNTTSTFYYPNESQTSINNTFDLGVETLFNEDWSARLQTYIYSLFESERRQVSYTLFLTYHWKQ